MPSGRFSDTLYTGTGSIEQMNVTALYKPGELGSQIQLNNKAYQVIQLDSGATAVTGAPVCGQLAFWKDRSKYLVTTDKTQAETGPTAAAAINSVAGVLCQTTTGANVAGTASITAGNYGVVQQRGQHVGVLTSSGTAAIGGMLIALTTGTPPGALVVTSGTALVSMPIGKATAATSAVTTGYTPATLGGWDLVDQG